jgi:hypothetical protein
VRILKELVASDEWLVTGGGAGGKEKAIWLDGPILPPTRVFFARMSKEKSCGRCSAQECENKWFANAAFCMEERGKSFTKAPRMKN